MFISVPSPEIYSPASPNASLWPAVAVKVLFSFACVKVKGWSEPTLKIASFDSKSKSSPITTLFTTDKPPSVWIEPSVVVVASVVSSVIILPLLVIGPDLNAEKELTSRLLDELLAP